MVRILICCVLLVGCVREGHDVGKWPLIKIDTEADPREELDTGAPPTENEQLLMGYILHLEAAVNAYNEEATAHNKAIESKIDN
jgi:hypothetical protein